MSQILLLLDFHRRLSAVPPKWGCGLSWGKIAYLAEGLAKVHETHRFRSHKQLREIVMEGS